jgi:hypothetical protein
MKKCIGAAPPGKIHANPRDTGPNKYRRYVGVGLAIRAVRAHIILAGHSALRMETPMTDTTTADNSKPKRQAAAIRDWIDENGNPVESGDEAKATGLRYVHLPTARRLDPKFDPETSDPHADAVFDVQFDSAVQGQIEGMLAIFGGLTLAGNIVNTAVNGPKGDPNVNPIPLIRERFEELAKGIWADRATGVGGVRYDRDMLAKAIATAKGETDPTPYLGKMDSKVDPKTGKTVPSDQKGAISYGAFALRNGAVKTTYDKLAGSGTSIDAL